MFKFLNKFHRNSRYKIPSRCLVILGNGFDLKCGLNSTSFEFFKWYLFHSIKRYHKLNTFNNNVNKITNSYLKEKGASDLLVELALNTGRILGVNEYDGPKRNSKLYKYLYNFMELFICFYYQLFVIKNPSKNKMTERNFNHSDLFHLIVYSYYLNEDMYHKNLYKCNKIVSPKSNYNFIQIFIELFYNDIAFFNNIKNSNGTLKLHYNFWMSYFIFLLSLHHLHYEKYSFSNWSDIEAHLSNFLTKYSEKVYKYLCIIIHYINPVKNKDIKHNNLCEKLYESFYLNKSSKYYCGDNDDFYNVSICAIFLILSNIFGKSFKDSHNGISKYLKKIWTSNNNKTRLYYYSFLYHQLYDFENIFSKFIQNCINNSNNKCCKKSYNYIAPKIIHKLLPNSNVPFNLISFNYVPIKRSIIGSCNNHFIVGSNMHSTISSYNNGHPIFGISDKVCLAKKNVKEIFYPYIIFSKTFRIMHLYNKVKYNIVLSNDINQIVFFGQSFSKADYPYFQSIFDKYSIYNSNIQLIFCYSVHDNGKNLAPNAPHYDSSKVKCATNLYNIVSKLIMKYGKSLSNKDHGHNLWTKLLIENRLIFHCIDDNY